MPSTADDPARTALRALGTGQITARQAHPLRALLGLLLTGVLALLLLRGSGAVLEQVTASPAGPIYSLASLRAALQHGHGALLDRPLRVRAVVGVCTIWVSTCTDWQPTPLTTLRRLPLLGRFLPAPQPVHWGLSAVYRVRVHLMHGPCGALVCLQADLLDAEQPAD